MGKLIFALGLLAATAAFAWLVAVPAFAGNLILAPGIVVGPFLVRWYGLFMAAALLVGYWVARRNAWRFGLGAKDADSFVFWAVIAGLVGARLYFVAFEAEYYLSHPAEIVQVWQGGLSVHGALLAGLVFAWWRARGKVYSAWQLLDLAALALPVAQAVGRLGNFFNYEAFGRPTDLPWRMFVPAGNRPAGLGSPEFFHPVFLYELLANLALFGLLLGLRAKVRPGTLALVYLAGYGVIRLLLEPLRLDSVLVAGWRVDQVMAGLLVLLSAALFVAKNRAARKLAAS